MKTYLTFGLENTQTSNFLVSVISIDNQELLDKIRQEQMFPSKGFHNFTLRQYIFDHIEEIKLPASFLQSLPYFEQSMYRASLLGSYCEISDAELRRDLSLDSFRRNQERFPNKYCYNLHDELTILPNEEEIVNSLRSLSSNMQETLKEYENNNIHRSECKQQSITIKNIETGEEHFFETKGDCTKFLECSSATFSKFLSGLSKLNKKWEIVD